LGGGIGELATGDRFVVPIFGGPRVIFTYARWGEQTVEFQGATAVINLSPGACHGESIEIEVDFRFEPAGNLIKDDRSYVRTPRQGNQFEIEGELEYTESIDGGSYFFHLRRIDSKAPRSRVLLGVAFSYDGNSYSGGAAVDLKCP
jgi:hypothetical protein